MATITEFDAWLDMADLEGHEEVYALHQAVSGREDVGMFQCQENNGKFFVTANHVDDTLMLASEDAYRYFLTVIEKRFGISEFGDIEGWYGYSRAMAKDD
ncbi:hypothetical protein ABMY37_21360 [Vibrio vulnificus]|uniref:hypothetical protein n=1 Tax=Vibrio vulnificus TaxID=672 RepID=UPI0009B6AD8E|nr:hypothetical protein [Vibrio vulnificus]OQK41915.1 hypothetical protein XM72_c11698 [Vibrio vulnificus]HAS8529119.1 hypothetical protein [Vibrio vulnificus]